MARLFLPQNDFAPPDHLVVQPQPVFVRSWLRSGPRRSAQQPHARGRLKDVRAEGAAVRVELDAQASRIRNPDDLIARVEHHHFRDQSHQHRSFSHGPQSLPSTDSTSTSVAGPALLKCASVLRPLIVFTPWTFSLPPKVMWNTCPFVGLTALLAARTLELSS